MSVPLSPQAIEQIRMRVENSEPLRHLGDTAPDDIRALLAEVARLQELLDQQMKVIHEIGVMSMVAQSDPHGPIVSYRKVLIDICNLALKAQDASESSR